MTLARLFNLSASVSLLVSKHSPTSRDISDAPGFAKCFKVQRQKVAMWSQRSCVVDGLESWGCTEKSRARQLTPTLKNVLGCQESARALGRRGRAFLQGDISAEGGGQAVSWWGPFPLPPPRCCSLGRRAGRALCGAMARAPRLPQQPKRGAAFSPAVLREFEGSGKRH